ncbi:MAG: LPXTG cell wall anchor domain-containing protein [Blastocatellia bacterium]
MSLKPFVRRCLSTLLSFSILMGPAAFAASVKINTTASLATVPSNGLGLCTAVYDGAMSDSVIPSLLKDDGFNILRYPGGSYGDIYQWQTGTITKGQTGYVAPGTNFDDFMSLVQAAGANALITVNYGSNTSGTDGADPGYAAGWVDYANNVKHYGVKYWEIGNEVYGNGEYHSQWELDLHTDHSPTAYGTNVNEFVSAMKAKDPGIKVGGVLTTPGSFPDGQSPDWNSNVLSACGQTIDFVVVHWYPSNDQINAPENQIPGLISSLRTLINRYCGPNAANVQIWVTEGNWAGTTVEGALFGADQFLTWWENGVENMDWQDLHNGISLQGDQNLDSGILSNGSCSGSVCEPATDTPFPIYYGIQSVKDLCSPGNSLVSAKSNTSTVATHAVMRADGSLGLMLINKGGKIKVKVTVSGATVSGAGTTYSYGDGSAQVISGSIAVANSFKIKLPPDSITDIIVPASQH